jgi:hypothetical protein
MNEKRRASAADLLLHVAHVELDDREAEAGVIDVGRPPDPAVPIRLGGLMMSDSSSARHRGGPATRRC